MEPFTLRTTSTRIVGYYNLMFRVIVPGKNIKETDLSEADGKCWAPAGTVRIYNDQSSSSSSLSSSSSAAETAIAAAVDQSLPPVVDVDILLRDKYVKATVFSSQPFYELIMSFL